MGDDQGNNDAWKKNLFRKFSDENKERNFEKVK